MVGWKNFLAVGLTSFTLSACILEIGNPSRSKMSATLEALETTAAVQSTQIASQATLLSYLATRVPAPRPAQPVSTPTPYYPVLGSVLIEDGQCCIGAVAGDTIDVNVRFEASSPFGEVTHMRVHAGSSPQSPDRLAMSSAWEPFAETQNFQIPVALNWVGFYVSVQYRDASGNLSPAFWDDISIEGQPPATP